MLKLQFLRRFGFRKIAPRPFCSRSNSVSQRGYQAPLSRSMSVMSGFIEYRVVKTQEMSFLGIKASSRSAQPTSFFTTSHQDIRIFTYHSTASISTLSRISMSLPTGQQNPHANILLFFLPLLINLLDGLQQDLFILHRRRPCPRGHEPGC